MPDFFFIGEEELCVAFRLVGVGGRAVSNREEALESFVAATEAEGRDLASKVLILSARTAAYLDEEIREWQFGGAYPLIVEIPSPGIEYDESRSLVAAIRQAVGIAI